MNHHPKYDVSLQPSERSKFASARAIAWIRATLLFTLAAAAAHAQTPTLPGPPAPQPEATLPGGILTSPHPAEPTLEALTRTGPEVITLQLAANKSLTLHDFDFNGEPVPAAKIHLRELSPGAFELSSLAYAPGIWRFHLTDNAAFYGFGVHFDTLDHAHTLLRNLPLALAGSTPQTPRGSTTPRPVPFFLSTTGYALYLDLPDISDPQDAASPAPASPTPTPTFDLNASDPAEITIDASTTRLRILLFTGTPGPAPAAANASPNPNPKPKDGLATAKVGAPPVKSQTARFPDLLAQFIATVPPPTAVPTGTLAPLATQLTAILSAGLSGLSPAPVTLPANPSGAAPARYFELAALTLNPLSCPQPGVDPALCTRYQALAKSLQPLREAAAKAHQPLLRPLALDFQDDPEAREIQTEFLLGSGALEPDLLAAPILDANTSRPVYLPAGEWHNLLTGETITGPTHILVAAPLDAIPLFARPTALLPPELASPNFIKSPPSN